MFFVNSFTDDSFIPSDTEEEAADVAVHPPVEKRLESETWHSGEQDTSQVSVSSLPEDEKSEPSVSSPATTDDSLSTALASNVSEGAGKGRSEPKGKYL